MCHGVAEVGEDLLVVVLGDGDVAVGVLSVGVTAAEVDDEEGAVGVVVGDVAAVLLLECLAGAVEVLWGGGDYLQGAPWVFAGGEEDGAFLLGEGEGVDCL